MLTIIANLVFKTAYLLNMSKLKGVVGGGLGYIELVSPDLNEYIHLPSTHSIPCFRLLYTVFISYIYAFIALRPY